MRGRGPVVGYNAWRRRRRRRTKLDGGCPNHADSFLILF